MHRAYLFHLFLEIPIKPEFLNKVTVTHRPQNHKIHRPQNQCSGLIYQARFSCTPARFSGEAANFSGTSTRHSVTFANLSVTSIIFSDTSATHSGKAANGSGKSCKFSETDLILHGRQCKFSGCSRIFSGRCGGFRKGPASSGIKAAITEGGEKALRH